MTVYIEYVFVENFLLDFGLLLLSFWLLKRQINLLKTVLASLVGALFAVLYPLLVLPDFAAYFLKFCVGLLLPLLASKKENGWGRYALNCLSFYLCSFLFAGFLFALFSSFDLDDKGYAVGRLPLGALLGGSIVFAYFSYIFIKKLYFLRKIQRFSYNCMLISKNNQVKVKGFFDSGNQATYGERPVCFLSGKRLLELIEVGQVWNEMEILTVSGEKKIKIFQIEKLVIYSASGWNIIEKEVENVYIAPSERFDGGEYELLLSGGVF